MTSLQNKAVKFFKNTYNEEIKTPSQCGLSQYYSLKRWIAMFGVLFLAISIPGLINSLIAEVNNGIDLVDTGTFGFIIFILMMLLIAGLGMYALIINQYFYYDEEKLIISRSKGLLNRNHKRIELYWDAVVKISQDTMGDQPRFIFYTKNNSIEYLIVNKWKQTDIIQKMKQIAESHTTKSIKVSS